MLSTKIRTTVVVLAAASSVVAAVPTVAQASILSVGPLTTMPRYVLPTTTTAARPVEAGSTGLGKATNSGCKTWAGVINKYQGASEKETGAASEVDHGIAVSAQNQAENEGCFIVNPV